MAPLRGLRRPKNRRRTAARFSIDRPLGAHLAPLRRHAPAVTLLCVLGVLVGLADVSREAPAWSATTDVLVPTIPVSPSDVAPGSRAPRPVTVDTEAQILLSDPVLAAAARSVPGQTGARLRGQVSLAAPPNSRVLQITVVSADPASASRLAEGLARAYLDARRQDLAERRAEQQRSLGRRVNALRALVAGSVGLLTYRGVDGDPGGRAVEEALLTPDLRDDAAVAAPNLAEQLEDLQAALVAAGSTSVLAGDVLRSGSGPQEVRRDYAVPIVSWGMLGLLAGLAWGRLRERYAQRVWSPADLGGLPTEPGAPLVAALPGGNRGAAAARGWERLLGEIEGRPGVRVVTPVGAGSYGGVALALVTALRQRGVEATLLLDQDEGVLDPLGSPRSLGDLPPEGQHAVVAGPAYTQLLRSLWLPLCDEVVLVVVPGRTSRRDLRTALRRTAELGVRVSGVVLDRPAAGIARHRVAARAGLPATPTAPLGADRAASAGVPGSPSRV